LKKEFGEICTNCSTTEEETRINEAIKNKIIELYIQNPKKYKKL